MEVKIKDGNGYVDADWTIEDGVMVVSPKEVFEPKDGDVVSSPNGREFFIFKGNQKGIYGECYCGYSLIKDCLFEAGIWHIVRFATEEEKKLLFDKLAEEGWEWKADTKELVKNMIQVYPKTYEECCKVLFPHIIALGKVLTSGYNCELLKKFGELLVCRDAYWKIAGDWNPDFRFGKKKYSIMTKDNKVINATVEETNRTLVFSTEEMRDAFYENFKDLICECKALL